MEELVSYVLIRPFSVFLSCRRSTASSQKTLSIVKIAVLHHRKLQLCIALLQNDLEGRNSLPSWSLVLVCLRVELLPGVVATDLQHLVSRTEHILHASLLSHCCCPLPNSSLPLGLASGCGWCCELGSS